MIVLVSVNVYVYICVRQNRQIRTSRHLSATRLSKTAKKPPCFCLESPTLATKARNRWFSADHMMGVAIQLEQSHTIESPRSLSRTVGLLIPLIRSLSPTDH